jgi:hypothetical protein
VDYATATGRSYTVKYIYTFSFRDHPRPGRTTGHSNATVFVLWTRHRMGDILNLLCLLRRGDVSSVSSLYYIRFFSLKMLLCSIIFSNRRHGLTRNKIRIYAQQIVSILMHLAESYNAFVCIRLCNLVLRFGRTCLPFLQCNT